MNEYVLSEYVFHVENGLNAGGAAVGDGVTEGLALALAVGVIEIVGSSDGDVATVALGVGVEESVLDPAREEPRGEGDRPETKITVTNRAATARPIPTSIRRLPRIMRSPYLPHPRAHMVRSYIHRGEES